ncbi:methyltransferase domain-containing protein [Candidatus Woesearchaeota archaeon]|nr:methyltransferase domain-containing protein [Candidatus Woesearchaeota archaeon]
MSLPKGMIDDCWINLDAKDVPASSGFSEKIFDYLRHQSKALDIGCGFGRLSRMFVLRGYETYGIDINKNAIEEAKRNNELDRVHFSVQDASNTNFANDFFDGIVSQAVLACVSIEHRTRILQECYRILKPRGVLQIAEFGWFPGADQYYLEHAKMTGEYGTVIVKRDDGSEWFRTHNFKKDELESLLNEAGLKVLNYECPDFISLKRNKHPGHIFLCQKIDSGF